MTKETTEPNPEMETLLADESLTRLRKAYHEIEAFALSDEHLAAKNKLRKTMQDDGGGRGEVGSQPL